MRKIPTLFERDYSDPSRVINLINPECFWVTLGEGVATRKYDGTCCLVRDGKLYKRYETKKVPPVDFEEVYYDEKTRKRFGWRPVGDGPEDKWHREAFNPALSDGTYELVGPKIQGNPERVLNHLLIPHATVLYDAPRTFYCLEEWLPGQDIEGIVWHHPDGRMAKIKLKDF